MKETGKRKEGSGMRALLAAVVSAFAAVASFGAAPSPDDMGCKDAREVIKAGGKLELGQWYIDWATCKSYAEANDIPVLFIWSNKTCKHCKYTDLVFMQDDFKAWAANNDAGRIIYCYMANKEKFNGVKCPDQEGSPAYNWMYKTPDTLKAYPFVTLYWKGHGGSDGILLHTTGDKLCSGDATGENFNAASHMSDDSFPKRIPNVIAKMEAAFKDWHPTPEYTYEGGWFTQTNYPWATPEAEKTTKYVDVEIRRSSTVVFTQDLQVVGRESGTVKVTWAEGQLVQTKRIEDFSKYFDAGKDVTLKLMGLNEDGKPVEVSGTKVKCFTDDEAKPSAANPKWFGEDFGFGEWTMDLTNAQKMVRGTTGSKVYTLVLMAGSLWCPDCYKTDKYFLNQKDGSGNNKFEKWAKEHNVALVQIDLPRLTEGTVMTPTLLSREPGIGGFSGDAGAWTETSGVGYLTRKGVSDAEAAEVLARNVELAQKNTYEGGFHRPEDTNRYRTGVPIFVLLRKDGTVAARLTRFASESPTTFDKFDNYLKRFDEMLDIAENNLTEIENNGVTDSNELSLKTNGGVETNRISHTDDRDVFRLAYVSGNAKLKATVKGVASDAEVVVSFVTRGADDKEVELASKGGKLDQEGGIVLESVFSRGGGAFVKVAAKDITSDAFKVDSPKAANFQTFEIKTELINLEPGEDKATAKPLKGSDTVTIALEEGTVYRLGGEATNCCAKLEAIANHPGFYRATGSGTFDLKLAEVDGELSYQKWKAGTVGFETGSAEVDRSVCDTSRQPLEIPVVRDAKSGWVKVRVSLDTESEAYADGRVWLMNGGDKAVAELEWADGDTEAKIVKVWIEDKLGEWDELTEIPLTITAIESECDADGEGYAAAIDEARSVFTLQVTDQVTGETGTVTISEVVPEFARQTTIYARESEGVTLTAVRKGGDAQLVAALLIPSNKENTTIETEDSSDITTIEQEYPAVTNLADYAELKDGKFLWWANRESGEKKVRIKVSPAGKSSKITLRALAPLENAGDEGSITIIAVKDSVPGFVESGREIHLTRYIECEESPFALTNLVADGGISFSKMFGKLPSGLKVARGPDGASMVLTGTPKAKPGSYPVTYRVKQGSVAGTTIALDIQVHDITEYGPAGEQPNLVVAGKSRTLKSIPVFDRACECMVGTLQLTVPATGKLSAKLVTADGKDSFGSKNWLGRDLDGTMEADLVSRKTDAILHVEADRQGGVVAQFTEGRWANLMAFTDGAVAWSKDEPADNWEGNYTVALENKGLVAGQVQLPGHGYLTLKMQTSSACRKGRFKVAGKLANGKKVSASVILQMIQQKACLPIFSSSSKDVFAALAEIDRGAYGKTDQRECVRTPEFAIEINDDITDYKSFNALQTIRASARAVPDGRVSYRLRGSWWNPAEPLCECQGVTEVPFVLGSNVVTKVKVEFADGKNKLTSKEEDRLVIDLKNSTGIIEGTIKGETDKPFFGIVVNGEKDCGCNPEVEPNPLGYGSAEGGREAVTLKVEQKVVQ